MILQHGFSEFNAGLLRIVNKTVNAYCVGVLMVVRNNVGPVDEAGSRSAICSISLSENPNLPSQVHRSESKIPSISVTSDLGQRVG